MAENTNKPESVFQGVLDAINGGKRKTPEANPSTQFSAQAGNGLVQRDQNPVEEIQQQYLDWQVNKIAHNLYQRTLYFDTDRISAYQDYRAMDMSPEIHAALDILRDEALTRGAKGEVLEIYSENARVKEVLKDLFNKRLNIEFNLKLWIRDLIKYGDYFVHLHIAKDEGIYNFRTLPVEEIHREEGFENKPDSVRFRWETTNDYFEEWQIAHFRILKDTKKIPYGQSILDPARKLWKQLQLAEDSMLVYRITRAPERRVFYIEIGNIEDADIKQYIQKIQNQLKKQPIVDSRTGNINMKYNPMNITEDYFIPIRGEKSSKIDTLPGASNLGDIQDIEYLQNKLFASLQVPKAYLNYAESLPGGSTLSQADLRFARTVNSIQEVVLMELRRVANIHLYFAGFTDDIDNFTLTLTNPSTQQELLKLETMKARLEVAKEYFTPESTSFASWTWVMENILGHSKAEIKLILKQKKVEKKIFAEIDSAIDTYKKIGLFTDLDAKYEIPGAVTKPGEGSDGEGGSGGGGGGMGGGSMGNMDIGSQLGGMDSGNGEAGMGGPDIGNSGEAGMGGPDMGAEGGEEIPTEETPLAESRKVVFKKALKESDSRFDNYVEDLLGKDEQIQEEENILIKNNQKLNYKTQKLMERIQQEIDISKSENPIVIQEAREEKNLFSNNDKLLEETSSMLSVLESMFKPKASAEEFEEISESDDNGVSAHQDDQQEEHSHDNIIGAQNSLETANQDNQQREDSMINQKDTGTGLDAHQDDQQREDSMFNDIFGK